MPSTLDHMARLPRDAELLGERGDLAVDAFRSFYERHLGAIRGYALGRVGPEAAEDIVSETFSEAWSSRSSFDVRAASGRPWLYGIATNVVARHRAREERWLEANRVAMSGADGAPSGAVTAYALDPELVYAIGELGPGLRDVFLLTALADLTVVETARALGITAVAARVRLHRARTQLRAALTQGAQHA